jgi:signal transduction histidine kinase
LFCIAVILVRVMLYRLDHRYLSGIPALLPEAHQAVIHWMADAGILALILTVFYLSISWKIREDKLNEKKVLFVEEMVHDMRAAFFAHGGICAALKYATDENLPLSNIKALIDKLEETKEFFNYVLNEMLNYSTLEKGIFDHVKYEDMDLTYEITKVVSAHNYQAIQNGITIHLKLAPGLPAVIQSDRVKVVRVLINLLSNAIKFTEPGKSIVVSADVYGPQWQLSVFNEGKQLTEEDMAGLFLLKRQMTDGRGQGRNGLGLPITKELVKRLGGTIHVNSAIDGTAFTVALPLS